MTLRRAGPMRQALSPAGLEPVIVILAKDEARVLPDSLRLALAEADGGGQVHVVADGCRDGTAAVAREAGAFVFERQSGGDPGKGAALNWWLRRTHAHASREQVIILLDADSLMQPGCVSGLVAALDAGADAAQAHILPSLDTGSPIACLAALSEIAEQRLGDALRTRLGWPVRLRGTGTALRRGLLEDFAPRLSTPVEDAELTLLLAGRGLCLRWVDGARLRDPKPANAGYAARQRARWLKGQLHLLRAQPAALAATSRRGLPGWSLLSSVLLKPRAFVLPLATGLCALVWSAAGVQPWLFPAAVLLSLWLVWNAGVLLAAVGWTERPGRTLLALLATPLYALLWLTSAALAIQTSDPWPRARPVDIPTRPAGEPGHVG